jgi:hypothetical protein
MTWPSGQYLTDVSFMVYGDVEALWVTPYVRII